jgi:hypothetical protein
MIEKARSKTLSQRDRVAHKEAPRVRARNPRNPRNPGEAVPLPPGARTAHPPTARSGALAAPLPLGPAQRREMIERAAYFNAMARGFVADDPDGPLRDWLQAEALVDHFLSQVVDLKKPVR